MITSLDIRNRKENHKPPDPHLEYPSNFFNGAAQRNTWGCGIWIALSKELEYKVHWNEGSGTNTRAEAMSLWGLIWFTHFLNIPDIHIFGDSKIIIDHVNGCEKINQRLLLWMAMEN